MAFSCLCGYLRLSIHIIDDTSIVEDQGLCSSAHVSTVRASDLQHDARHETASLESNLSYIDSTNLSRKDFLEEVRLVRGSHLLSILQQIVSPAFVPCDCHCIDRLYRQDLSSRSFELFVCSRHILKVKHNPFSNLRQHAIWMIMIAKTHPPQGIRTPLRRAHQPRF